MIASSSGRILNLGLSLHRAPSVRISCQISSNFFPDTILTAGRRPPKGEIEVFEGGVNSSDDRPGGEDVTVLLDRVAAGDRRSTDRLLDAVYDQLRRIAQQRMKDEKPGHTLQATALVHEAYLRLLRDKEVDWSSRARFYVAAAQAMQRILVEHARGKKRLKRGGDRRPVASSVLDLAGDDNLEDVVALHEAVDRLEEEDPRAALVTRLRFYAGLTVEETAKAMGLSERTVMREWRYARAWLRDALDPISD
jgi:RNA polymerase sigma factor (TIGR02999 family)